MEKRPDVAIGTGKLLRPDRITLDSAGIVLPRNRRPRDRGSDQKDLGQFDVLEFVDAASGAAMMIREATIDDLKIDGELFDETFFAYMEEIDLCWRIQLLGYRVVYVPTAIVYHIGGFSLDKRVLKRMYLNHRNSMIMLLKNYALSSLLWAVPIKLLLEGFIAVAALLRNPLRSRAVVMAFWWIARHLPTVLRLRADVQARRRVPDRDIYARLYLGMAPLWYFVFGIRQVTDLPDIDRVLHRPYRDSDLARLDGERVRPQSRNFLYAYLDQAPTGLAIQRAVECRQLAQYAFERPILDVGCGDGVFSRMLFNGVIVDAAVDADASEVERARRTRCYGVVKEGRVEALPFEAGSIATVLANGVLNGVQDVERAFLEIHRVLREGGRLYCTLPTPECTPFQLWNRWLRRLRLLRMAEAYERLTLRLFRAERIDAPELWADRLRAAGFEVESTELYLSRRAATLQDLFMPLGFVAALSKRVLGHALVLPRTHRLFVRVYRHWLRASVEEPVDEGTGVLFVAVKR